MHDVAAAFVAHWIVMGPMYQATKVVPLVDTTKMNAISQAERHPGRQLEIVRNEQCPSIAHIQDKTLMRRGVVIVSQHAYDNTAALDPVA